MRSILAQEPPAGGFEVIVVDGMSDDGTRDVLARLAAEHPNLRVVDNPERITPSAMNRGIGEARGRYVAIMGAHNRYPPDYLSVALEVATETGADNVGGAVVAEGTTRLERAIAAAHHSPFAVGGARWHDVEYDGPADTVFGGFYRREVFDRIGGFDEELVRNQDDELNLRLVRAGGRIWKSRRIRSWYRSRRTLRDLWRQYRQYGYWKVRVIQKHRLPASIRHLVPAGFVGTVILLCAGATVSPASGLALAGVLGTYAAASLLAAVGCARRHGWDLLPVLPGVFACYHVAYGVGFLVGLWDFALWRRGARDDYTTLTRGA